MSDSLAPTPSADRNLLFGILALQMDFITRDALVAAMHGWVLSKTKPLGEILLTQGQISGEHHALVEAMVQAHLRVHHDDPQQSLASLAAGTAVRQDLARIADADLQASLAWVGPSPASDPETTGPEIPAGGLRFRVLRPHARGGLGEVFVALDEELHREVALKEMQPAHAANPLSRSRFLLEAEITGGLEHPGVVPVYGLGTHPDGRPFYAMRFIRGDNLQEAVRRFHEAEGPGRDPGERTLEFRQLLRRFVDVCNAVAFAHGRGVLHRDLKPGDIMLGKYGETLVVDWGVAKPFQQPAAGDSAGEPVFQPSAGSAPALTQHGSAVGTPAFMSPEQASGQSERVGPASDIYSLGATLYVLLTGQSPFPGREIGDVLRRVQRGDWRPARQVKPQTPAALDAVCAKAMALRPEDRYGSALALAADIEHWLADEPVSAFPEPWHARLGRWARRHKPLVSGAAALLVTAVVGLAAGAVLLNRANVRIAQERARAETNFQRALRAVDDYLTTVSESKLLRSPLPGLQPLRKELLEAALKYYQAFVEDHGDDAALQAELAAAYLRVGMITAEVISPKDALTALREAQARYDRLAEAQPANASLRRELARTLSWVSAQEGKVSRGAEAEATRRRAIQLMEQLLGEAPDDRECRAQLAGDYVRLGEMLHNTGRGAEAEAAYRRAVNLQEELVRADPTSERFRSGLASTNLSFGFYYVETGKGGLALPLQEQARDVLGQLAHEHPGVLEYQTELARAYTNIGYTKQNPPFGKQDEAAAAYHEVITICQKLARENPQVPEFRYKTAGAQLQLAGLYGSYGRPADAIPLLREAVANYSGEAGAIPDDPRHQSGLGSCYRLLGTLATEAGDFSEAEKALQKGLEVLQEAVRRNPTSAPLAYALATIHRSVAQVYAKTQRPEEALWSYEEVQAVLQKLRERGPRQANYRIVLASNYQDIGAIQQQRGQAAEAAKAFQQARELREALVADYPAVVEFTIRLGNTLQSQAELALARGDLREARALLERAIGLQRAALKRVPKDPMVPGFLAEHYRTLAEALLRGGDHAAAAQAAADLAGVAPERPDGSYQAACLLGRCVRALPKDQTLADAKRQELTQSYGDQAARLLREAVQRGFKDLEKMKTDGDLEPLRGRTDFQQILAELQEAARGK